MSVFHAFAVRTGSAIEMRHGKHVLSPPQMLNLKYSLKQMFVIRHQKLS